MKNALFGFGFAVAALSVATASAQSEPFGVRTTLQGDSGGCLTPAGLRGRIAHYLTNTSPIPNLEIRVSAPDRGATEFVLESEGSAVAMRRFRALPKACASRVDVIALAIALAYEHARRARAEATAQVSSGQESAVVALSAPPSLSTTAEKTSFSSPSSPEVLEVPERLAVTPVRRSVVVSEAAKAAAIPASMPAHVPDVMPRAAGGAHGSSLPLRLSIHAGGSFLFEVLPAPAIAGVAGAELSLGDFSARISGMVTPQTRSRFAGGEAFVQLIAGDGALCRRVRAGWLVLNGCLGAIAGRMFARGEGYGEDANASLIWVGALGRLALRVFVQGAVSLEFSGELYANLIRPSLHVLSRRDEEIRTAVVSGGGGLQMVFTP